MSPPSQQASTLAVSTRSGIITPFGSLVEPLVYCRITRRSGSGAGISSRSPDGTPGAPGSTDAHRGDRRVARRGLVERRQHVVDQHELGVAVADAGPRRLDERLQRPHAHRQREHHRGDPGHPAAADDRHQATAGRPEDGDVVAGAEPAGLEGGADDAGLVVELAPRHELRLAVGHHRGADEAHAGPRVRRLLESLDRRLRTFHTVDQASCGPSSFECFSGEARGGTRSTQTLGWASGRSS